eukprot:TRINITY_DN11450_c0_g1_i2.p1 TRINITY_DN11450_c0_g1~~TRINITY_DN11450_c0_g1_i2.p1  ORF type:complete len:274 (-),score=36.40 TRINITY_DN11450_c0_g1_i2:98-919(-)
MEPLLVVFSVGYLLQHLGSAILIRKILKQKTIEGLSNETQIIFLVGCIVRCVWVKETRLLRLWLYQIELLVSVVLSAYIVYLFRKYKDTRFTIIKNPFDYKLITLFCMVLSFIFHPGSKNEYYLSMQMLVSFSMFVEACGLLPQIYLLRKIGEIEAMTGHYLFCLAMSRIFRMVFWIMMYLKGDMFAYLIIADLLHTILLADFIYFYIKNRHSRTILLRQWMDQAISLVVFLLLIVSVSKYVLEFVIGHNGNWHVNESFCMLLSGGYVFMHVR